MDKIMMFTGLYLHSIKANAYSCIKQLEEYPHLKVSKEQAQRLGEIEKEFHRLVQEITQSQTTEWR